VGGVYLVSLLLAAATGAVMDLAHARGRCPRAPLAALAAVVVIFAACGWSLPGDAPGRPVRLAAVQTNVPQSNKMGWTVEQELHDFQRFQALTRDAADQHPTLIAWPETMMPGLTLEPDALRELRDRGIVFTLGDDGASGEIAATAFADGLLSLQRDLGVPMLVGEEARTSLRVQRTDRGLSLPFQHRYNSAYLVSGGSIAPTRYDKLRLTPFGETMPYFRAIPGLQQKLLDLGASGMAFDLSEGTHRTVFDIPTPDGPIHAVTPICFESTVSSLNRSLLFDDTAASDLLKRCPLSPAGRRADLIVNLTNDGWFGPSLLGRLQHLQAARWRSLETATPTLRVANTGVSAVIDSRGRLVASGVNGLPGAAMTDGVLTADVRLGAGVPLFARVGDTFGWLSLFGALALLIHARLAARTSRAPATNA
jgi:apolipoprotein N-acyltransferase